VDLDEGDMTDRDHFAAAALTGLLTSDDVGEESNAFGQAICQSAYLWADAMLRERAKTNHDAAPAARAAPSESSAPLGKGLGTGDTTEPVAWAVMLADGERIYDVYALAEDAKAIDEAVTGNHGVLPLYRQPPCQEFSRKNWTLTDAEAETLRELRDEAAQYADEIGLCASEVRGRQRIIDGLLERMGGGE
jgi:hypothetical protein